MVAFLLTPYLYLRLYSRRLKNVFFSSGKQRTRYISRHYFEVMNPFIEKLMLYPGILREDQEKIEARWKGCMIIETQQSYFPLLFAIAIGAAIFSIFFYLEWYWFTLFAICPVIIYIMNFYWKKELQERSVKQLNSCIEYIGKSYHLYKEIMNSLKIRGENVVSNTGLEKLLETGNPFLEFSLKILFKMYALMSRVIHRGEKLMKIKIRHHLIFREFDIVTFMRNTGNLHTNFSKFHNTFVLSTSNFYCWLGMVIAQKPEDMEDMLGILLPEAAKELKQLYTLHYKNLQKYKTPIITHANRSQAGAAERKIIKPYRVYMNAVELLHEASRKVELMLQENTEDHPELVNHFASLKRQISKAMDNVHICDMMIKPRRPSPSQLPHMVQQNSDIIEQTPRRQLQQIDASTQNQPEHDEEYELYIGPDDRDEGQKSRPLEEITTTELKKLKSVVSKQLMNELVAQLNIRQRQLGKNVFIMEPSQVAGPSGEHLRPQEKTRIIRARRPIRPSSDGSGFIPPPPPLPPPPLPYQSGIPRAPPLPPTIPRLDLGHSSESGSLRAERGSDTDSGAVIQGSSGFSTPRSSRGVGPMGDTRSQQVHGHICCQKHHHHPQSFASDDDYVRQQAQASSQRCIYTQSVPQSSSHGLQTSLTQPEEGAIPHFEQHEMSAESQEMEEISQENLPEESVPHYYYYQPKPLSTITEVTERSMPSTESSLTLNPDRDDTILDLRQLDDNEGDTLVNAPSDEEPPPEPPKTSRLVRRHIHRATPRHSHRKSEPAEPETFMDERGQQTDLPMPRKKTQAISEQQMQASDARSAISGSASEYSTAPDEPSYQGLIDPELTPHPRPSTSGSSGSHFPVARTMDSLSLVGISDSEEEDSDGILRRSRRLQNK